MLICPITGDVNFGHLLWVVLPSFPIEDLVFSFCRNIVERCF